MKISSEKPLELVEKSRNRIFNFINSNTIYWLKNSKEYSDLISRKQNLNFVDGKILSIFLKTKQVRGPTFTREFLTSDSAKNKKHFFIGLEKNELKILSKKTNIPLKNLSSYNPPYIKELNFPKEEIKGISQKLKKSKPYFVWVSVGSPKQEILANELYYFHKTNYLNIGAGIDFLLEKKKEAPKIFSKLGLEWFYRLVTDFKYSKQKVARSFIGIWYLIRGKVEVGVKR